VLNPFSLAGAIEIAVGRDSGCIELLLRADQAHRLLAGRSGALHFANLPPTGGHSQGRGRKSFWRVDPDSASVRQKHLILADEKPTQSIVFSLAITHPVREGILADRRFRRSQRRLSTELRAHLAAGLSKGDDLRATTGLQIRYSLQSSKIDC
jgi:hypothetical protein